VLLLLSVLLRAGETIRIKRGEKQNYTAHISAARSFRFAAQREQRFNVLRAAQMMHTR
jgi:hypothetical protein